MGYKTVEDQQLLQCGNDSACLYDLNHFVDKRIKPNFSWVSY